VKHLNCKLYYRQLPLKYWCNLARYRLQAVWGWHDSVETCSSVIICEIIVHLLVTVQNEEILQPSSGKQHKQSSKSRHVRPMTERSVDGPSSCSGSHGFGPRNRGRLFWPRLFWNVSLHKPVHTASHPRYLESLSEPALTSLCLATFLCEFLTQAG